MTTETVPHNVSICLISPLPSPLHPKATVQSPALPLIWTPAATSVSCPTSFSSPHAPLQAVSDLCLRFIKALRELPF